MHGHVFGKFGEITAARHKIRLAVQFDMTPILLPGWMYDAISPSEVCGWPSW